MTLKMAPAILSVVLIRLGKHLALLVSLWLLASTAIEPNQILILALAALSSFAYLLGRTVAFRQVNHTGRGAEAHDRGASQT
jgi:hypothetical protein